MTDFRSNTLILLIVTLAAILPSVVSLKCWDCSSHINSRCGDPFDSSIFDKVDCNQVKPQHLTHENSTSCRKIIQKVQGKTRVIRGCGYIVDPSLDKNCIKRAGTFEVTSEYCTCSKEGCNGSSTLFNLTSGYLVIVCTAFTSLLLMMLNHQ